MGSSTKSAKKSVANTGSGSDAAPAAKTPGMYTGKEYLESLRDGREVWIYGERVKDVTIHPAFRNSARMFARLYDALHDVKRKELLTMPIDNGSNMRTHRFFQASHTVEEQIAARDAIADWARMGYGWMGRTPDYKAAWVGTLACNSGLYEEYQPNADRWYDIARERVPYINHAIVHPPVDRHLPNESVDVFVQVEKETDKGLVISGAKVVATGAALTQYTFVGHYNVEHKQKKFSPIFIVRNDTPGLKLICRSSYEMTSAHMGSPFDYPLSSRMDENDSVLVLDKVLVPWEDVLMYGVEMSNRFIFQSGFLGRTLLHGSTRLAVKLDFICGLLLKAVEITGTKDYRGVQAVVGEVIGLRNVIWGLSDAIARSSEPWVKGYVLPNAEWGLGYRTIQSDIYSRVRNLIGRIVASGLIYLPSHAIDFSQPQLRPYLDKYMRGSRGVTSVERAKVMRLLWDAVGTEFANRHDLYEMNYSGSYEKSHIDPLTFAEVTGKAEKWRAYAQQCMDEYDLDGWTVPDLVNPDDVNLFARNRAS